MYALILLWSTRKRKMHHHGKRNYIGRCRKITSVIVLNACTGSCAHGCINIKTWIRLTVEHSLITKDDFSSNPHGRVAMMRYLSTENAVSIDKVCVRVRAGTVALFRAWECQAGVVVCKVSFRLHFVVRVQCCLFLSCTFASTREVVTTSLLRPKMTREIETKIVLRRTSKYSFWRCFWNSYCRHIIYFPYLLEGV